MAQATIMGRQVLFRKTGYHEPRILVTSDDDRFDSSTYYFGLGDEASLFRLPDGTTFHWRCLNFARAERSCLKGLDTPVFRARQLALPPAVPLQSVRQNKYSGPPICTVHATPGSVEMPVFLLLASLDHFLHHGDAATRLY